MINLIPKFVKSIESYNKNFQENRRINALEKKKKKDLIR